VAATLWFKVSSTRERAIKAARKKAATRDVILRAGMDLFSKHGIVVAFLVDVDRTVERRLAPLEAARHPLVDTLTEFIAMQWRMKERHHQFVRLFFAQMFLHTDTFLPYMADVNQLVSANIAALFEVLRRRGDLRTDIDVGDLTMVFVNLQFGLTAMWAIEGPPFAGTEMVLRREMARFCSGIEANAT
jgi:hypothetical protein